MSTSWKPYTECRSFYGKLTPRLLAQSFGTPLYVYNEAVLRENCRTLKALSRHPRFGVNYSVKANANPVLLRILREEGLVVDAMSEGELFFDTLAGFTPDEILYISNNNSLEEMATALAHGVIVSVDSLSQLEQIATINQGGKVMIRINPGIGRGHSDKVITAGKSTKFGILPEYFPEVVSILERSHMTLAGINQHIGSLFMESEGYLAACRFLLDFCENLPPSILDSLEIIDFGGGFGIPYHKRDMETPLDMQDLGQKFHALISDWAAKHKYAGRFLIEPGRYVMAEACVLLGRVNAVKRNGDKLFTGTDIGFNVLMRPVLYDSYHEIETYPLRPSEEELVQTVTGNICESGDILAKERRLPRLHEGDLIGVLDAGAYGYSMASSYNQRLRPAEVLITCDGYARCIRRRETLEDLALGVRDFL